VLGPFALPIPTPPWLVPIVPLAHVSTPPLLVASEDARFGACSVSVFVLEPIASAMPVLLGLTLSSFSPSLPVCGPGVGSVA
jgi:hypothetical protein